MFAGVFGALFAIVFSQAKPVWPAASVDEMNRTIVFEGAFEWREGEEAPIVRSTGSSVYRVEVNGSFAYYGPARGPHGYYRVDEVRLAPYLRAGTNRIVYTVAGYNVNSYYLLDQPPFLQAEVTAGGRTLWATDASTVARPLASRLQKVSRYSFQRPFGEAYDLTRPMPADPVTLSVRPDVKLLLRRAPMPEFRLTPPMRAYARGRARLDPEAKVTADRAVENAGRDGALRGFAKDELECNLYYDARRLVATTNEPYAEACASYALRAGDQLHFQTEFLNTGFILLEGVAKGAAKLAVTFDEVLACGRIVAERSGCGNLATWRLEPGKSFAFETFEPYTLKYLTVTVLEGEVEVRPPRLREYAYPLNQHERLRTGDPLDGIRLAARRTFAQNAVDTFTDCPGRERAGWLCDSFWTARASLAMTGSTAMEYVFLENYALPERFEHIDEGMVPMCYPGDHDDECFIPNWAMWYVLELDEFASVRGGSKELVAASLRRVEGLLKWFAKYENDDGLLEKMPKWNFIEWSHANDFVQDVNYPANMAYAAMLDAASRLTGDSSLADKAEKVRATVVRQSYNGKFFRDHAVRDANGRLTVKDDVSETCQYYAFFFGTATEETHPELWRRLMTEFGPERERKGLYPEVHRANAFVGNYMRLELLLRAGLKTQLRAEILGYFDKMAKETGTLWEHDSTCASCCHGFASYVGVLLEKSLEGKE